MGPSHTLRSVAAILLVGALTLVMGCGPNARQKALKTSLVSMNAARDGFTQWDKQKQAVIVADAKTLDEGKKALADHRSKRVPVVEAFTVAYSALALAALDDNAARLLEAVGAVKSVYDLIKTLTGKDP